RPRLAPELELHGAPPAALVLRRHGRALAARVDQHVPGGGVPDAAHQRLPGMVRGRLMAYRCFIRLFIIFFRTIVDQRSLFASLKDGVVLSSLLHKFNPELIDIEKAKKVRPTARARS